ncbi:unnamed protein product [Rodentolepis nana]|uniref:Uncharacterized protein n=1 Tax=Rodentolepis nana TaxID=102285 RepID=A0A0R3T3U7_RODNA|nr:unnamed protein product [Rodentolepis nana]
MAIGHFPRLNSRQELQQQSLVPRDGETETMRSKWSTRLYAIVAIISCILAASMITYGVFMLCNSPNKAQEIISYGVIASGFLATITVLFGKFISKKPSQTLGIFHFILLSVTMISEMTLGGLVIHPLGVTAVGATIVTFGFLTKLPALVFFFIEE